MNASLRTAAPVPEAEWQWADDVLAFAEAEGVRPCLEPMLAATRRLFPTAEWIKVYVELDPEIRDDQHILFDVRVRGLSLEYVRQTRREWNNSLLACCPTRLAHVFRLLLDLQK